jgi:serine protease AprX
MGRVMTARAVVAAMLAAALAPGVGLAVASPAIASPSPQVEVIVREAEGVGDGPERLVELVGGTVVNQLPVIDGFLARVSTSGIATLRASSEVLAVSPNAAVQLTGSFDGFSPTDDLGSMYWVGQEVTGAGEYWNNGFFGQGVGVALIDSGVAPVEGLTAPGKVLHGPDLSFESQHDAFRNIDTYGHGTHMAGIIAGRDTSTPVPVQKGVETHFVGMAPEARLLSIKVADSHGNTDVSQVIAAIDWVVQHRNDPGLNIKVLNLSFGTDGVQNYRFDPLSYAAEVAWRAGIVVVVAAGNGGDGSAKLNNPAYDPFVLAVGGADGRGTYGVADDVIGSFSSHGDAARAPDLVAPGKSIVSLLSPGSRADIENPGARVGTRQIRGTGTSQSAAVVSGAAALVISQRPGITPNQVKKLLTSTAQDLPAADHKAQGAGMIDLKVARDKATPSVVSSVQAFAPAVGTGSLDGSRGSRRLSSDGATLDGERDIFGAPFVSRTWAVSAAAGTTWTGGQWNANRWSGQGWTANRWSSQVWSANRWSGKAWSADAWSANRWSANRWSGAGWSANRWSANRWSANRWSSGIWG